MPGLNRRGPEGMGPMTGGGRGLCNPASRSAYNRGASFAGGSGLGRGMGFGRRQALMCRRQGFRNAGIPDYDPAQEEILLRNEAEILKGELDAIENRLNKMKEPD